MRLSLLKKLTLALVSLVLVYLLLGWFVLPRVLQSQAEKYIAAKTGGHLTVDLPEFNPLKLSLNLTHLYLEGADHKPLLALKTLGIHVSAQSLYQRSLIFESIRLDKPEVALVLQHDGRLNWQMLIEALSDKKKKSDTTLPRLTIQSLTVNGGRLDFSDAKTGFHTRADPIDLTLNTISTLPNQDGWYAMTATTTSGARIFWQGQLALNSLSIGGVLSIKDMKLANVMPYCKKALPLTSLSGLFSLTMDYRAVYTESTFKLSLANIAAKLKKLNMVTTQGVMVAVDTVESGKSRFDLANRQWIAKDIVLSGSRIHKQRSKQAPLKLLQLSVLTLKDIQVDLKKHSATFDRIAFKGGNVEAVRLRQGSIDVLDALKVAPAATPKNKSKIVHVASTPWRYRVNALDLSGFSIALHDETMVPAAELVLQDVALAMNGISNDFSVPLPIRASCRAKEGGRFEANGTVIPAKYSADIKLKLTDLALQPAQPYLSSLTKLALTNGSFNAEGQVSYNEKGFGFKGGLTLRKVHIVDTDVNKPFLAWESMGSEDVEITPTQLNIGNLIVNGLETQLIINKDKSVNLAHILRRQYAAAPLNSAAITPPLVKKNKPSPFLAAIDRLRIQNSEMDFADYSLALPFATRIHNLHGTINGLSFSPGAKGQLELEGQVNRYGFAQATGEIDLFNPLSFTDINVVFRNIEMTQLTPYSTTFAGRKIDSGKLFLNLQYKIKDRQLLGTNRIVMDKLVLGERVKSSQAKDLPLDLAIAILKDSNGRINLGLPVSGSLDDPQFSYSDVMWKALTTAIKKVVTAPFRMLGALFGGKEEAFANIVFEAGGTQLLPPEYEKLTHLAEALNTRKGLAVTVYGVYADIDKVALQDVQLRRIVAIAAGQHMSDGEDPGPLSTSSTKVRTALETLFSKRFGKVELETLKEEFRKANPGQMQESAGGKMISRLSDLFRRRRELNSDEIQQLKGADFYAVIFERLREKEIINDDQLQLLAKQRRETIVSALQTSGVPAERLIPGALEHVESKWQHVPVKLVAGVAPALNDIKR